MEQKKILLLCPMLDQQSGFYIHDSLIHMGHKVAFFDWRQISENHGVLSMNNMLIDAFEKLTPDLAIIVKGLGIYPETIKKIKEFHKNPIVGWIFDPKLGNSYVKDVKPYTDMIKELDIFYSVDGDAVADLAPLGVNCKYLGEACYYESHKPIVFNSIQKRKFGSDIVFMGSIDSFHKERMTFLKRIVDEGFNLKIYGNIFGNAPSWALEHHTKLEVINDMHSLVSQASKIVIGTDECRDRKYSFSARLYRVLCAGGFYLTTKTNGIEEIFTPGTHLDIFDNENELIEKIIKYLKNDELRNKIAEQGQKEIMEKHQFKHRLQQIFDDANI